MAGPLQDAVTHLVSVYGYWMVGLMVGLESLGLPLPGETALITAALYASATHRLAIAPVIAAAAGGAIVGASAGFWIGRHAGYGLLLRHGGRVGLTEPRLRLGQYLFLRHGGKIVFFGRFVPVLRALAAVLAGTGRMSWRRFLCFNVAGGIVWVTLYGLGAYAVGAQIKRASGPCGMAALVAMLLAAGAVFLALRRHQARLHEQAACALPGGLRPLHARDGGE